MEVINTKITDNITYIGCADGLNDKKIIANFIDCIIKEYDFIITYFWRMGREDDFGELYIFLNGLDLFNNEEKIIALNKELEQWFIPEKIMYVTKARKDKGFYIKEDE